MLDVVLVDGKAKGIVTRNLVDGKIKTHSADIVILATGVILTFIICLPTQWQATLLQTGGLQERGLACKPKLYTNSPNMYPRKKRLSIC